MLLISHNVAPRAHSRAKTEQATSLVSCCVRVCHGCTASKRRSADASEQHRARLPWISCVARRLSHSLEEAGWNVSSTSVDLSSTWWASPSREKRGDRIALRCAPADDLFVDCAETLCRGRNNGCSRWRRNSRGKLDDLARRSTRRGARDTVGRRTFSTSPPALRPGDDRWSGWKPAQSSRRVCTGRVSAGPTRCPVSLCRHPVCEVPSVALKRIARSSKRDILFSNRLVATRWPAIDRTRRESLAAAGVGTASVSRRPPSRCVR